MKQHLPKFITVVLIVFLLIFSLTAWNQTNSTQRPGSDTIPTKKIKDIDDAVRELEKATMEINKTDWDKIQREVNEAMKKIDMAKMKLEVEKQLKEVDVQKIRADVEKAMKEMEVKMKEIDVNKIKAEVDASLAKVDMEKMRQEIEKIKQIDLTKIKADVEKAKKQINEYKNFLDDLEKDGLIERKSEYTVEHKNGELIINGKKQSADVYNKYRSFLEKHKEFKIKKTDDNFNLDID
ncbi:MAG: hypothetical protein ICV66_09280 [Chitinophagaceae bacterium]|nr:hypothetical protein [Chitinophagaceae bacterium]